MNRTETKQDLTSAHSLKGLETLRKMNTAPSDWGLTPIKWEKKLVKTKAWVRCGKCRGEGYYKAHPKLGILNDSDSRLYGLTKDSKDEVCTDCPRVGFTKKGRDYAAKPHGESSYYMYSGHHGSVWHKDNRYSFMNGLVVAEVEVEREVGTVLWAKGTKFDSRFGGGADVCQLCSKVIPSGRVVPLNGKEADGTIHGIWAGEDCARKFFGVKAFKPEQIVSKGAR